MVARIDIELQGAVVAVVVGISHSNWSFRLRSSRRRWGVNNR
jgi:hypothetical protein